MVSISYLSAFLILYASIHVASPSPAENVNLTWCIPKDGTQEAVLQGNINYACANGADCSEIQPGQRCYLPNTNASHAAFAMNSYYYLFQGGFNNCDFKGTGNIVSTDPSYGKCIYEGTKS